MRICHVTPHLPPDQAANALLPFHLGTWAVGGGDEVSYVAHAPRQQQRRSKHPPVALPGPVAWVPTHREAHGMARVLRVSAAASALAIARAARPSIAWADVVHVHSNGLIAETAALLAERMHKPVVLTLYGTEILALRAEAMAAGFLHARIPARRTRDVLQPRPAHAGD